METPLIIHVNWLIVCSYNRFLFNLFMYILSLFIYIFFIDYNIDLQPAILYVTYYNT